MTTGQIINLLKGSERMFQWHHRQQREKVQDQYEATWPIPQRSRTADAGGVVVC